MTTVETRVVETVPKHSSVDVAQTEMEDNASEHAEGNLMIDEEIDSHEGEELEEHMINVAIMNSVADVSGSGSHESTRYGLRKRPRPGDASESEVGESAPKPGATAFIKDGRLNLVPQSGGQPSGDRADPRRQNTSGESSTGSSSMQTTRQNGFPPSHPSSLPIQTENVQVQPVGAPPPIRKSNKSKPAASKTNKVAYPGQKGDRQASGKVKGQRNGTSAHYAPHVVSSHGSVPNPLSLSTPSPGSCLSSDRAKSGCKQPSGEVPCPLPAAIPCPLPHEHTENQSDSKVTFADLPPSSRSRVFSVDLDPSTFDFPEIHGDHRGDDDIADITGSAIPDDLAPFKRDRAFSFEFFTFGDDLLPAPPVNPATTAPLPEPAHSEENVSSRPRGDSIIFDPSSFQDGGIHEKNAIIKVKAAKNTKLPKPGLLADSRLAAPPPVQVRPQPPRPLVAAAPRPAHNASMMTAPPGADSGQVAALPSALSVPDANGNNPGTFQMELLNKDGRIGIYLPDARRARIARFHAKRKMRIWRKRIKYDCRKKLADSRPRIKGRFVKRTDMDE